MRLKSIFLVFTLLVIPTLLHSQGALLEKGQSGMGFFADGSISDFGTVVGLSFVNSFKGIIDFGIGVDRVNPKEIAGFYDAITFHVECFPVREDTSAKGFPLNFSVIGFWTNQGTGGINGYGFGSSIFKRGHISESLFLLPRFSYTKIWPSGLGNNGESAVGFDLSMVLKAGTKQLISITGAISRSSDIYVYGALAGVTFLFPQKVI